MTDAIHYLSLSLTNVRAFGGRQTLDLSKDGKPSRWCVILGENGVGKTTLMLALAAMRPVPAVGEGQQTGREEASDPIKAEPGLADFQNDRIFSLVRHGKNVTAAMDAVLVSDNGEAFEIGYDIVTDGGELASAEPRQADHKLIDKGPLVIGYSAFRQPGHGNLAGLADLEPTESLFDPLINLVDPNEVAVEVDYQILSASRDKDQATAAWWGAVQDRMAKVIAALIPNLKPEEVSLAGPGGIQVRTPSGMTSLAELSLGAQTMVAWVLDLAWRLCLTFPKSTDPFGESAIVLIDEVELHLHPKWQRVVRAQLLQHFPKIQFIVTTHAPVTAQESIAAGDPISIVRWDGDHSVIVPDPFPQAPVRLDEVAIELFQLETSLPQRFEALLQERRELIRKDDLSDHEKYRLLKLNQVAHAVRSGEVVTEEDVERLMVTAPVGSI